MSTTNFFKVSTELDFDLVFEKIGIPQKEEDSKVLVQDSSNLVEVEFAID